MQFRFIIACFVSLVMSGYLIVSAISSASAAENIRIGLIEPLSGPVAAVGTDALQAFEGASVPSEVRLRVVGRTETLDAAQRIGREVESLLTNGPCGGGGASRVARATVAIESTLVPRAWVPTSVVWEKV